MSALVPPHGDSGLQPLQVEEARAGEDLRYARSLRSLRVTSREKGDLVMLGTGGFTPLRGFMSQADWRGVVPVKRADLQPGDLLFFGSSPSKITHTGMYIGSGKFIHDTTHDHPGVQISVLDDQPWTKLLVAARRIK